jgi:hypothetical protein
VAIGGAPIILNGFKTAREGLRSVKARKAAYQSLGND